MNQQNWNAQQYENKASFVAELGNSLLELLDPKPHETILDLGCGDGTLTKKINQISAETIGIDSSESMITAACKRGLNAFLMNGDSIVYTNKFDAVFSNATLHWISDYQAVIRGVHQSLKKGGRFVGEFGGYGNIGKIVVAMKQTLANNPDMGTFVNPWFFPSAEKYKNLLEENGFSIHSIELIQRPTPLNAGIKEWLKIFANHLISGMEKHWEEHFLNEVQERTRAYLYTEQGGWVADYVRLRFSATKP